MINGDDRSDNTFDTAILEKLSRIRAIARRILVDPEAVDDVTREVILRAYANRSQL